MRKVNECLVKVFRTDDVEQLCFRVENGNHVLAAPALLLPHQSARSVPTGPAVDP